MPIYDDKSMKPEELVALIESAKQELDRLYRLREAMVLEAYAAGVSVSVIAKRLAIKHPNVSKIIKQG